MADRFGEEKEFLEELRSGMAERGWNQARLAEALNVSEMQVSRVLRGEHSPTVATMRRYLRAVGRDCQIVFSTRSEKIAVG